MSNPSTPSSFLAQMIKTAPTKPVKKANEPFTDRLNAEIITISTGIAEGKVTMNWAENFLKQNWEDFSKAHPGFSRTRVTDAVRATSKKMKDDALAAAEAADEKERAKPKKELAAAKKTKGKK